MKDSNKKKQYNITETRNSFNQLFDNLPEVITPSDLSKKLGVPLGTIYDWRYRGEMRRIPKQLFLKIGGKLFLSTSILKKWVLQENPFY